jgi:MFS family permease
MGLCYRFDLLFSLLTNFSYTPGVSQISADFHVGKEVSLLGVTFLLLGFGFGPLIWAPLSELYGRKSAVITPYFIAAVFSFGTATAKDIQTVLITRFFAGFFGSAPVTNTGGVLGDLWSPEQRGAAIVGYAMAVVGGPILGPIVGGAIVQSYLRWRWTEYVSAYFMETAHAYM